MSGVFHNLENFWSQVSTWVEENLIDLLIWSNWIFSVDFTADVLIYVLFIVVVFLLGRFMFQTK